MFHNPQHQTNASGNTVTEQEVKEYFETFYEGELLLSKAGMGV